MFPNPSKKLLAKAFYIAHRNWDYINDMTIFIPYINKNIPNQMLYHRYLANQYNLYYQFKALVNRVGGGKKVNTHTPKAS